MKYRVHYWNRFQYSDIGEYVDENHTDKPLRNDEVVDLLNNLSNENEELLEANKNKVEIINKFYEENEQLKSTKRKRLERLRNQRKELSKQQEAIWGYKGDIKQLRKENEHLKKENKQLKSEIRYFQSKLHNNTMEVRELTLGEVKESIRKLERWE